MMRPPVPKMQRSMLMLCLMLPCVSAFHAMGSARFGLRSGVMHRWVTMQGSSSSEATKQKVAVIGSGAVGLYYGGRLQEAGHDVRYLARRDLEVLKEKGLQIESVDGDVSFDSINVCGDPKELGEVDWVLLSLKSYSLPAAKELIAPCMGPSTRILAIMNGMGIEDTLSETFPAESIFGGMAFTCNNRVDGIVKHLKYGKLSVGHNLDSEDELHNVEALFKGSKVTLETSPCLLYSRWEKLCWNIPFNGLAVAMGGITTDKIVEDKDLREVARGLMEEVILCGNKDLQHHGVPEETRLTEEVVTRMFTLTDTMGPYRPSTMIDLVEQKPMEVEYIFSNPLRRARKLGCACPQMATVIPMIQGLQRLRGL